MVILNEDSPINAKTSPVLFKWDNSVRKNHALYQREIDKLSYHLQRVQRYIFSLTYPHMYQRSVLRLDMLKKKQMLGAVTKEELTQYGKLDPSIHHYFNKTFNVTSPIPYSSFVLSAALFVGACFLNLTITHRLYTLIAPPLTFYFLNLNDVRSDFHTSQFLDWTLEKRKAECAIEKARHKLHLTHSDINTASVFDQYKNLLHQN